MMHAVTMKAAGDAAKTASAVRALAATRGDVSAAAALLGIQRSWLYALISKTPKLQRALKRCREKGGR